MVRRIMDWWRQRRTLARAVAHEAAERDHGRRSLAQTVVSLLEVDPEGWRAPYSYTYRHKSGMEVCWVEMDDEVAVTVGGEKISMRSGQVVAALRAWRSGTRDLRAAAKARQLLIEELGR